MCSSIQVSAQNSIYGEINSPYCANTIIRDWGNQFIIYGENHLSDGFFHLLTDTAHASTVLAIDLPTGLHVKDFKILDGQVFFIGEFNRKAACGNFNISGVFYGGNIISYYTLDHYNGPTGLGGDVVYRPTSLNRMEVYMAGQEPHIVAIGDQVAGSSPTSAVFHIPGLFPNHYNCLSSSSVLGEGIFFDLALTDNFIVSVAHKGTQTNLLYSGYIMMRAFKRTSDPLNSITGQVRNDSDGYIITNGTMSASGISGDNFAISYCHPSTTNAEHEFGILTVNPSGVISPVSFKRTNISLSNASYYSFSDMAYNNSKNYLIDVGNIYSNNTLNIYSSTSSNYQHLYNPNFEISSACSRSDDYCAACGNNNNGTIGFLLQVLPVSNSCATISNESYFSTYPLLRNYSGIHVDFGTIVERHIHIPTVAPYQFTVFCNVPK